MTYKFEKTIHAEIGTERFKVSIEWRNGTLIADEPVANGGKDLGPDPFTLLLSSLASCTLATLRMYIDHKGWDVPELKVNVNMFQQTKGEEVFTIIDRDIHFSSNITEEQRNKLLEVAGKCPISKLLKGTTDIRTYLYHEETSDKKINYTNGEITVEWTPDFCKHSGRCVMGLPTVFDINKKPWINMQGADTAAIIAQVDKCPTGALKYHYNKK